MPLSHVCHSGNAAKARVAASLRPSAKIDLWDFEQAIERQLAATQCDQRK